MNQRSIAERKWVQYVIYVAGINGIISLVVICGCAVLVTIAKRGYGVLKKTHDTLEHQVDARTKEQEVLLQQSEVKFRAILEGAPDATIIVGEKDTIQLANKEVENIFRYPLKNLLGKPVELLMPERFRRAYSQHRRVFHKNPLTHLKGVGLVLAGLRQNSEEFPVEISLSPLKTADEEAVLKAFQNTIRWFSIRLKRTSQKN